MISVALEMPFPFTADTVKEQSRLAKLIDAHNLREQANASDEQALKLVDEAEWTGSHERSAGKIRNIKIELCSSEIGIREEIEGFYGTVATVDFPAAVRTANDELEDAKRDVTAGLVALGYIDGPVSECRVGIEWQTLYLHPRVSAAYLLSNNMSGSRPWHDNQVANLKAIATAKDRLGEVKRRGLALLA